MHISNHLILRQWNSRPSTSEFLVSTSSEEGTAWRGDVSRFPKALAAVARQRWGAQTAGWPRARMGKVLQGGTLEEIVVVISGFCFVLGGKIVLYGTMEKKYVNVYQTLWYSSMKYVWNMYEICMAYVWHMCSSPPAQAWTLCDFVTVWRNRLIHFR